MTQPNLSLARKYDQIFIYGHYLLREEKEFSTAKFGMLLPCCVVFKFRGKRLSKTKGIFIKSNEQIRISVSCKTG